MSLSPYVDFFEGFGRLETPAKILQGVKTHVEDFMGTGQYSSGIISSTGKTYIVGASSTGISNIATQSGILELSDTGSIFIAKLPLTGLSISRSGAWDGTIDAPIKVQTATGIRLMSGTIAVDSIYTVGNNGASLTFSGQVATITVSVSVPDGSTVAVYRSPNATTSYTKISTCIILHNVCTFTTDHFSLFAIGIPVVPLSESTHTGPGGGGISTSFLSQSISSQTKNILTPFQIQYKNMATGGNYVDSSRNTAPINISQKGFFESKLATLDYGLNKSQLFDTTYTQIIYPFKQYIDESTYARGGKLILYDRAMTRIQKIQKDSKRERVTLSFILQELSKARKQFILREFGYKVE